MGSSRLNTGSASCMQISIGSALSKSCMQKQAYGHRPRATKHRNFSSGNVSGLLHLQLVFDEHVQKTTPSFLVSVIRIVLSAGRDNVDMNRTVRGTHISRLEGITIFLKRGQKVGRPWPPWSPLWCRPCGGSPELEIFERAGLVSEKMYSKFVASFPNFTWLGKRLDKVANKTLQMVQFIKIFQHKSRE